MLCALCKGVYCDGVLSLDLLYVRACVTLTVYVFAWVV